MKDEQVIKKLKLLRQINPSQMVLNNIKQSVYQQVKVGTKQDRLLYLNKFFSDVVYLIRTYRLALYSVTFRLVLLVFLFALSILLPNQFHQAILYTNLVFAPNQYQRSRIAFQDTRNEFGDTKLTGQNVQELSQSLALVNTELSNLKLKGVKGEYTQKECHKIYQDYLVYLKKEVKNIPSSGQVFSLVKSQISLYQEQAEKKLHMYNS